MKKTMFAISVFLSYLIGIAISLYCSCWDIKVYSSEGDFDAMLRGYTFLYLLMPLITGFSSVTILLIANAIIKKLQFIKTPLLPITPLKITVIFLGAIIISVSWNTYYTFYNQGIGIMCPLLGIDY